MEEEVKIYEIINPSDPYTIKGSDEALVCVATFYLGDGAWGLRELDKDGSDVEGDMTLPIFRFGGDWKSWFLDTHKIADVEGYIKKNAGKLADCLETVLIGSPRARTALEAMLAAISDEKERKKAHDAYADKMRSSLNDIGSCAQDCVKLFRKMENAKVGGKLDDV